MFKHRFEASSFDLSSRKSYRAVKKLTVLICTITLILTFSISSSFAQTPDTTTTAPTTTAPTVPTTGDLDSDLPGATTVPPAGPTKEQTIAQQNAKKADSKLDAATRKLLDAQLAADTTSLQIQTNKATLLDLKDKIEKNEALLAVQELPLNQLSKIIKKRAVTLYQDSSGKPTDALEQFYYNRGVQLAGSAQNTNTEDFKVYNKQRTGLANLKKSLAEQKTAAELQEKDLQNLSVELAKQLEDAKKAYEKNALLFLDASSIVGARLAVDGKMCPIAGPITHVNDWGNPRSGGRTHKGNDVFAAMGTPNVAIVDGTIQHLSGGLGGTGIFLSGVDGNTYYYAHLSALAGPPRAVRQGEVIGYTGNSGNAAGGATHTHFEIRVGGTQHVNPYPILRIICGV